MAGNLPIIARVVAKGQPLSLGIGVQVFQFQYEDSEKEDDLFKWAKSQKKLFHVLDAETQVALREVMAQFPRLVNTQKERSTADPVVIALARVKSFAVITGEKAAGNDARPRIPNVCDFYSVRHLTLPELIRERRWRF